MAELQHMLPDGSNWNSSWHLYSYISLPPEGYSKHKLGLGDPRVRYKEDLPQMAPLRRDWLVFWNSQIENRRIYHHIGVEFLLLESNISVSEKPKCQEKRRRPAWEINFDVQGGPLVVHLSLPL